MERGRGGETAVLLTLFPIRDMEKLAQDAEKQARRPAPHRPDVTAPKRARTDDAGDGGEEGEQAEQGA